jgi:hypothetical protein
LPLLNRSIFMKEAFNHSILLSMVQNMRTFPLKTIETPCQKNNIWFLLLNLAFIIFKNKRLTLFNIFGVKLPPMVLTSKNSTLAFVAIFLINFSNNASYLMIFKEWTHIFSNFYSSYILYSIFKYNIKTSAFLSAKSSKQEISNSTSPIWKSAKNNL